jgi:hypothetical protein
MKTFACVCCAVLFPLHLMGQDATALRKEFSKLNDRGLSRDVLNFYEGKLLPISDSQSGKDLRVAINNLQSLNALAEFDGLVEPKKENGRSH